MKFFNLTACIVLLSSLYVQFSHSQQLNPGLNQSELSESILVNARTGADSSYASEFPEPKNFSFAYRSPEIGLRNVWELWIDEGQTGLISVRGTIPAMESWLANFYAAMVPAKGALILSEADTFQYQLAKNLRAAVHIGWLISTAYLSRDMLPIIDSCYHAGITDFIITGHSQGGGISYLLMAYLLNLKDMGKLPQDMRFKTYSTAAPKPGNLYFAYEYESRTQEGWAFNVVNSLDWVPEVPFSLQTLDDFNDLNPFKDAKTTVIKKQKLPRRVVMSSIYNQLDKPSKKARKKYKKYLGTMISHQVSKTLPDFQPPEYYNSNHYVRTGKYIILTPDAGYYEQLPGDPNDIW
jgi:hypothetical protein